MHIYVWMNKYEYKFELQIKLLLQQEKQIPFLEENLIMISSQIN